MPQISTSTRKLKAQVQETGIAGSAPKVQYSYRFSDSASKKESATRPPTELLPPGRDLVRPEVRPQIATDSLFSYDTKYIFRDIRRTAVIAGVILLLLAVTKAVLVAKGL